MHANICVVNSPLNKPSSLSELKISLSAVKNARTQIKVDAQGVALVEIY